MPLVIESLYSWDDGFMSLGKVSILQRGCAYCQSERPPIISRPMHCYSLGIDMLHKSELLDCQALFLQPVTWPACQGPHVLVSVYWPDALRQGTVRRRVHHYFSQTHTQTHNHTHLAVHYAHPRTFQYCGMVYPISCTFFEAWIPSSDTPLAPVFFHQPLSVNKPCLHYRAGEYGLKRDVFHLSTTIMLPIRRDIFISTGRDVRPDWADSCALMERDNRLSGVRSHSRYPAIRFH